MAIRRRTPTFRILQDRDITFDGWSIALGDSASGETSSEVADWSYDQPLRVGVSITADWPTLRGKLDLGPSAIAGLLIAWRCPSAQSRGASEVSRLDPHVTNAELTLIDVPLADVVHLQAQIVLVDGGRLPGGPLGARVPGSVLWSTDQSVRIEGDGSRFPTAVTDFKLSGNFGDNAHWHFELNVNASNLDHPADSAMRLWLNETSPLTKLMLAGNEGTDILGVVRADIYRQLVRAAVQVDPTDFGDDHPEGSVGAVLVAALFVGGFHSHEEAIAAYEHNPSLVDSRLQSAVVK